MSPREAVCQYMGWEFTEASDYRYHYGRTNLPVYSYTDGYVCAVPNGKKPSTRVVHGVSDFTWKEATGFDAQYCKNNGKTIFISKSGD